MAPLESLMKHIGSEKDTPEEGLEKIEKVISNQGVDDVYRGWACRIIAYWMQEWGRDEEADLYRQRAISYGYSNAVYTD